MSRQQLEHALERLRHELDDLDEDAVEVDERLRELIDDVEGRLDALERGDDDDSLVGTVTHFIEQFEVEHPRVTNILNDIMVTLSNMGI
jgi:hypothetical protein